MTTVKVKDATGQIKYFEVIGAGTELNPFRQIYEVSSPTFTRTPRLLITSTNGTIAAGSKSVAIANIGSNNGTIAGTILPPGVSVSWEAQLKDTIDAIIYDANNTTFLISTLT